MIHLTLRTTAGEPEWRTFEHWSSTSSYNLQHWEIIHRYFLVFSERPGLKNQYTFDLYPYRFNIKDFLGKSNWTRCMTGEQQSAKFFTESVCECHSVCELKEGGGTGPQIPWRTLQKKPSEGSQCFSWDDARSLCDSNDLCNGLLLVWGFRRGLGHTGAARRRGAHLGQNLVQPLQRTVQVQLDPTWSACYSLPPGKQTTRVWECTQCVSCVLFQRRFTHWTESKDSFSKISCWPQGPFEIK